MLREPLAQRFLARCEATGDNRVRSADDVLGERIARLAAAIGAEHAQPGVTIAPPVTGDRLAWLVQMVAMAVRATPYLWTEEVRATLRTLELPRHVLSPRLLPQPRCWFTFETGIHVGGVLEHEGRRYEGGIADALLLLDAGRGFTAYTLGEMHDAETGETRPSITGASFEYGMTYPDDFTNEAVRTHLTSALALCSFLASPFIPKRQERASRAARREAKRLGRPVEDELVTFVILRRPATRHHDGDAPADGVEWRHRWLVSGHVRAQWYPSEQAHRLIWIAPYLKGPEDAPMLEHAYKVAR
jgi:hypothetical protein